MATLKELNEKAVRHVPTSIYGGDLPGQETKTHGISDASWRIGHKHIYKRIHTRFVVAEVGSPLEAFPSSKVMFGAIHDAFQGKLDNISDLRNHVDTYAQRTNKHMRSVVSFTETSAAEIY